MQKLFFFTFALIITCIISCHKRNKCNDICANNFDYEGSCEYQKPVFDGVNYLIDNCKPPFKVNFSAKISNVHCPINYEWNFGDGETSIEQYPSHVFLNNGNYHVSVKATNKTEITIDTFTLVLDTLQPIIANFDYSSGNNNFRVPAKIYFFNHFNFATDFYWDFGDGTTSTDVNPSHVYTDSGTYNVSLKSSCGSRQALFNKMVIILPKPTSITLTACSVTGGQALSSEKGTPIFLDMRFNNNSIVTSGTYLFYSYPAIFYLPVGTNGTNTFITNFASSDIVYLNAWIPELGSNNKLLCTTWFSLQYLNSNYYPEYIQSGYMGVWLNYQ